ncbi:MULTISPECIES: flagellin [unclassified Shinella]|uniref:flagellin N-terminal helical domain-containing protein n=1 Tax=unclassified Shinella TaxID=2643062 RepID=UPI00234F2492|nr:MULTISPECIES: flagellin [unclassified Shinella]MCO5138892.1 flagellin [Shinella sp.]MDC7255731.1 flagellin [Shinella sp. YE25]CAK7256991.1 flagellin [Shinella sp. WSC3-e]
MTSILTNTSAIAALQTLRSVSSSLTGMQNQVSSGLGVAAASDNAAYWSISTTMRSDQMAMSAVQDAIGLRAAKVDTAYAAMESTIDVLKEFQAKLVAAKEDGVDRAKIQTELEALKAQTVSISQSASFNGVNWLNTAFTNIYDTAEAREKLTTSFVRSSSGAVHVKSTEIDLSKVALFNSTGGGLLQVDDRSPGTVGGIRNTIYSIDPVGRSAWEDYIFDGPLTFTDNSTAITFTLNLDADDPATTTGPQPGMTQTYTIDRDAIDAVNPGWNGIVSNRSQWRAVLKSVIGSAVEIYQDVSNPAKFSIETTETSGRGSSYYMSGVTSTLPTGETGGLQDSAAISYGTRAYTYSIWDTAFELKPDVEAYITIIENNTNKTLTLTRDTVMAALGTTSGEVTSIGDYIQVLNYAFIDQGMGIEAKDLGMNLIRYDLIETMRPEAGRKTSLGVTGATDNIGNAPTFGLLDVDVTSNYSLDAYISGVDGMMSRVINGAATLGAVKKRLEIQESYNQTIIDSVQKGIGRLVDADMNEASVRLKALETQQQLSIQALSIANENPSTLLQLFR